MRIGKTPKKLGYFKTWLRRLFGGSVFNIFQLEVTSRCNCKCIMCPRVSVTKRWKLGDMSMNTFSRISKYFPYSRVVYLSGWGEPLLHEKIVDMVRLAKEAACIVGFTTNGMLVTERKSQELVKLKLDMIGFSMDGATPKTYESIRVGVKFDQLIENVRTLNMVKRKTGSNKPEVVLTFLMLKKNINELPLVVDLAHELAVDRIVATNLDCVVKSLDEELRVFSSKSPERAFVEKIEEAKTRAERYKIPFYAYPIELQPTVTCAADPLRNVFFTWDGMVAPCVYASIPVKQGFIPRVFCGKRYKIPRLSFGDITKEDFFEIWNKREYWEFRRYFQDRESLYDSALLKTMSLESGVDFKKLEGKREELTNKMKALPLPVVCETCYKAYGV